MKRRFQSLSEGLRNRLGYSFLAASSDIRLAEKQCNLIVPASERHRAKKPIAPTKREAKLCFWSDAKYLETILEENKHILTNNLDSWPKTCGN